MKLLLAISFLLAAASAYRPQFFTNENGEREMSSTPDNSGELPDELEKVRKLGLRRSLSLEESLQEQGERRKRELKGGRGKGRGGSRDESDDEGYDDEIEVFGMGKCVHLRVMALADEIEKFAKETPMGSLFHHPVYDPLSMKIVATFKDFSVHMPDDDCVYNGVLSTHENNSTGTYDSQIFLSGSCSGTFSAITGGTGMFSCASGFEVHDDPSETGSKFLTSTLFICNRCLK